MTTPLQPMQFSRTAANTDTTAGTNGQAARTNGGTNGSSTTTTISVKGTAPTISSRST